MQYLSDLTTQASGSAGGVVASHNQHVRYLRARTIPVDPATPYQRHVRARFRTLSAYWFWQVGDRGRQLWEDYAKNVPVKNALGDTVYLTGRHHFIRINMAFTWIRPLLPLFLLPPTKTSLPAIGQVTFGWQPSLPRILVYFDNTQRWAREIGGFLAVYQSSPRAQTINFFKGPWRWCNEVKGNPFIPPTSPQVFTSSYPIAPSSRIFFQYRALRADARVSNPFTGYTDT